jgi:hypothetical protein
MSNTSSYAEKKQLENKQDAINNAPACDGNEVASGRDCEHRTHTSIQTNETIDRKTSHYQI